MKRRITLIMILTLCLGLMAGCSVKEQAIETADETAETSEIETAATTEETSASDFETEPAVSESEVSGPAAPVSETAVSESAVPASEAEYLEDFTVQTIDGGTFTLSEALKDHELVLINLFATWCGPCEMEFPYLQEAWSQSADKVAVAALSIEPEDSDEVLKEYAKERNLTFPMGHSDGTDLERFVTIGIPTTLIVDASGKVATVEIGAKGSAQEFLDLFDKFTGENYDPNVCQYSVHTYDGNTGDPLEGVVINFCTDDFCTPVTTDAEGNAVFTGPPAKYHVQIIRAPEGMQTEGEEDFYTKPYAQIYWIPFMEGDE